MFSDCALSLKGHAMSKKSNKILMFQTADAENYSEILGITSNINKIFCQRSDIEYKSFVGLQRGYYAWHATFNRIPILNQLVQDGFDGWAFYVDADAFVYDLQFDLHRYLTAISEPFIFAPGGTTGQKWDVNDGVFLINLGAPLSRKLIRLWYENFMSTTEEQLRQAKDWYNVMSCQPRLHKIFQANPDLMNSIRLEPREFLNHWNASFVRQILRSNAVSFQERVQKIRSDVDEVLRQINGASNAQGETGEVEKVSREEVIYAYRFLLGRDPEDEAVIRENLKLRSWIELRKRFINSAEFVAKNTQKNFSGIPANDVNMFVSEENFSKLIAHIQSSWEILGREKPHWSVLTQDEYLPQNIKSNINRFFETGNSGISSLSHALSRSNRVLRREGTCVELGCGVGRVTFALAKQFRDVTGIDVSRCHLSIAESYKVNNEVKNVTLLLMESLATLESLPSFDFLYSTMVLQHNPPPLIDRMLRILFKKINDGGLIYFQVPVAREGYSFSIDAYLQSIENKKTMEMHVFPQVHLFKLLDDCGLQLLDLQRDNAAGPNFHSFTMLAEKRTQA